MTIARHQSCAERRRKYGPLLPMDATIQQVLELRSAAHAEGLMKLRWGVGMLLAIALACTGAFVAFGDGAGSRLHPSGFNPTIAGVQQ